ncbi:MAG TPA: ACP S-malonyltransferase [Solirubrobacteraceae bacterium]|jgi:malonyl CoA-acyl carrier protein transacylase|nr:ACP S-malonyltransferase [Solirubrobacteraceae bacterium]
MRVPPNAAFMFPGQGSPAQDAAGLIAAHCADLHERACELIGCDPVARAADSTRFAQPAVFLASLAGWRSLGEPAASALAFAGHSLGELSALTAAGALAAEDGLALVVLRGRLMGEACEQSPGGMLAVAAAIEDAVPLAREFGLHVANRNSPRQTVLAGAGGAVSRAAAAARERGIRALDLGVAGAFHSPAMAPAQSAFLGALRSVSVGQPCAPVLSGLTARPFADVAGELTRALCAPVRWREAMLALERLGARAFVDVGPGRVLAGLARRNLPDCVALDLEEPLAVG